MLLRAANGFGGVALAAMLAEASAAEKPASQTASKATSAEGLHHAARAKNVIFLYMDGGPSQVDTFDPKPRLDKENGKPFPSKVEPTQFDNVGMTLASPWKFEQHGESGIPVSALFPHLARCVDDMCVIRSMTSEFSEHTNANYFLHTGSGLQGRPSMGAWITYGLGSQSQELPGFVVIDGGLIPPGGLDNFNSGFLPATYQGSVFKPTGSPVANIVRGEQTDSSQRRKLDLVARLDRQAVEQSGKIDAIESAILNYELAYRMQTAVPKLVDFSGETEATHKLYGLDASFAPTKIFAAECLLARRLVEQGVRFVELTCPKVSGDRWDQHGRLREGHEANSLAVDQPIAALLTDLKSRGLLDSTLVVWAGEFGRTPFAQGKDGRDHNPFGFTVWMAGGGVRGGMTYGATDEFGYKAIEKKLEMHDLHATMLHLLGVDHTRQTFRFGGRDMRLTDVHGHVVTDIIA
jgi:hypothetical protein